MNRVHGLTLVEVAIALLIIALLFGVGLPAYQNRQVRQIVAETIDEATPAKDTVQEYASFHGNLPSTQEVALPFVTSRYIASTSWAASGTAGTLTISTRSGVGDERGDLDAKAVVLTASYNASTRTVDWICGRTRATTVAEDFLPVDCRAR